MAPLLINTSSSSSATNRTLKSISPLSTISTTRTSNQSSMKQLIRLIGIAILCFGAGLQFGRDSSVQQINLSSNRSISSSSSKDIVSNAILTNSNKDDNIVEEQPSSPTRRTNTNINTKNNKRPNKIILLGERHSGTNWITNYLKDCFISNSTNSNNITVKEQYKRFKHWFQEDDLSIVEEDSAVVVSMFRDPMDWVEAMRAEPHHAHDHLNWHEEQHPFNSSKFWHQMASPLGWKNFVSKPWIGRRGPTDYNISYSSSSSQSSIEDSIKNAQCMDSYTYVDAAPCSAEDSPKLLGLGEYKYEFKNDGSERAYSSILELRAAKIINHLSVANFRGTHSFFYYRFEDLKLNGTETLLKDIEEATGIRAKCDAIYGKVRNENGQVTTEEEKQQEEELVQRIEKVRRRRQLREKIISKKRELSVDFIKYMNKYVDWDVERLIGYYPHEIE